MGRLKGVTLRPQSSAPSVRTKGVNEDDEDRALLAWLRDGARSNDEQDQDAELRAFLQAGAESPTTDLDSELRDFGLSASDRRKILQSGSRTAQDSSRYKTITFKRFRWWIDKHVDWSKTEWNPDYVVAVWLSLTGHNLELAKSWWGAGINPLDLEQIAALAKHDLRPRDLAIRIGQRTIYEHIRRGTSVEWCVNALNWNHRRNAGA